MSTKQLLLDIIGLTYRRQLQWNLIKRNTEQYTKNIPKGMYLLADSPTHECDIYVRVWFFSLFVGPMYVMRKDLSHGWTSYNVYKVSLRKEKHLRQELVDAVWWYLKNRTETNIQAEINGASSAVDDLIRKTSQDQLTDALKGI